jgi:DNA-binding transcriptional LysR family regulator
MAMTAAVVARYSEQHGDEVEIVLSDMPNDGLLHALHSGQLDFCVGIEVPGSVSLESVGLFEDELVLVTAGRHALAPLKEVRWEQLAGQESSCSPRAASGSSPPVPCASTA